MNKLWTIESFLSLVFALLASLFLVFSMQSCSLSPEVRVSEVQDLASVIVDRTEAYVIADVDLPASTRDAHLSRVERMRDVLVDNPAETVEGELAATAARPVCELHDAYVTADASLDATARGRALRSTEIMRRVLDAAAPRQGP